MKLTKSILIILLILLVVLPSAGFSQARRTKPAPKSTTSTTNAPTTKVGAGRIEYAKFHSASLGQDVAYAVSLPASYDKAKEQHYPVVIFLHGLFNDEHDWQDRGIQDQLDALRQKGKVGEYIVAIPYGASSFYLNSKEGVRYEDAIVQDFLPFVDKEYRTLGTQKGRLIEGISMGGYGALMIAFKHPELFAGVAAHCAALFEELPSPPASKNGRGQFRYELATKIFGNPLDQEFFQANSPLYLAKANANKIKDLKIYFDIGKQDRYGFEGGNQKLSTILTEVGIKHEFHLAEGEHGWSFLVAQSDPAFSFCWQTLKP